MKQQEEYTEIEKEALKWLHETDTMQFSQMELLTMFVAHQRVKNYDSLHDVRLLSDVCDAEITKHADTLDTPEGQDQYTHDTAFINGAIWMREQIGRLSLPTVF